jgi:DnaJ-class molecular chaperone
MFDTLTRGDLYVIINVIPNERFEIHGTNLVMKLEVNSIEAMTGIEKTIESIDGKEFLMKIPQGCQYGSNFGIPGRGLYQMNNPHRGDMIITVIIKTPTLTDDQLNVLKNIQVFQ